MASQAVIKSLELATQAAKAFFDTFIVDGVAAARVQEDAINALNIALAQSGRFSQEASQDFQAYASSLQQATTFGDEVILQNAALLQSLGKLSGDGLKEATRVSLDLAAALNIDLQSAVTLVGKAAAGEVGTFSRYGIIIRKGKDETETFANALRVLNDQFGGAAAGRVQTFSGAFIQLSNTFGDTQESIGQIVTESPLVIGAIQGLNDALIITQKVINENRGAIDLFVADSLRGLIGGISSAGEILIFFNDVIEDTKNFVGFLADTALASTQAILRFGIATVETAAKVQEFLGVSAAGNAEIVKGLEERIEVFERARLAGDQETAARVRNQEEFAEAVRTFTSQAEEAINTQIDRSIEKNNQEKNNFLENVNAKNQARLAEIEAEKQKNDRLFLLAESQKQLDEERRQADLELKQLRSDEDFAFLEANLGREKALQAVRDAEKLAQAGKTEEGLKKLNTARTEADKKSLKSLFDFEKNTNAGRAANFKSTLSTIATLSASGSKELGAIGKTAAVATATIDGIVAVQKALASASPPFNFALAALVGVATASNIAKIKTAPAFQDGGIVPGNQFSGDNVLARVNSGELILNRAQQTNVASGLMGAESTQNQILTELQRLNNQTISLQVDGREIARTIRDQDRAGFAFA